MFGVEWLLLQAKISSPDGLIFAETKFIDELYTAIVRIEAITIKIGTLKFNTSNTKFILLKLWALRDPVDSHIFDRISNPRFLIHCAIYQHQILNLFYLFPV